MQAQAKLPVGFKKQSIKNQTGNHLNLPLVAENEELDYSPDKTGKNKDAQHNFDSQMRSIMDQSIRLPNNNSNMGKDKENNANGGGLGSLYFENSIIENNS